MSWNKAIPAHLASSRLVLRPLEYRDAGSLFAAFGDPGCMRYWSRGPMDTVEELEIYLKGNIETTEALTLAITEPGETRDRALGWVAIFERDEGVELGVIVIPEAQHKGLAKEALARCLAWLDAELDFRWARADIDPDNEASLRLFSSLGFRRVDYLKGSWATHIGVRDSVILQREF